MAYDVVFSHDGDAINYTPNADVAAGQVVLIGSSGLIGVTRRPISANTQGTVWLVGVYDFPKGTASTEAWSPGAKLYWDNTNKVATSTSSGNTYLGFALSTVVAADTTARVRMNVAA